MREQIILVSGVNESELLRTFAKFKNNTIGLRVVNATELAKIALMKSGISITEDYVSSREEPSIIYSFLNKVKYFESASFSDAGNLSTAINSLRMLVETTNEEDAIKLGLSKGEFKEKNDAILEVYQKYANELKREGLIDSIGIIRKALTEAKPFDADFVFLKEYPLTPIDISLLNYISNGEAKELSILDFLTKEEPNNIVFKEAYGEINEAEDIISSIYKDSLPLDKCVVSCADSKKYAQIFYDLSRRYDIPMTFGTGIPIINSNPAKLLNLISIWDSKGYHGIDALKDIIYSESFSRTKLADIYGVTKLHRNEINDICTIAGSLKLSFDSKLNKERIEKYKKSLENKIEKAKINESKELNRLEYKAEILNKVEIFSSDLGMGIIPFIEKYSVMRDNPSGRIDKSALNVIKESLDAFFKYSNGASITEIIPEILEKTVCSEISREGALHITSVQGAISSLRENLFVCGLSSQEFPGTPTENYLLLDDDLLNFTKASYAPTSTNRINNVKESLLNLIKISKDMGVNITLSYSEFNLAELKEQNPSSMLFSIFEDENPNKTIDDFRNSFVKVKYFESELSKSRLVSDKSTKGYIIEYEKNEKEMDEVSNLLDKEWSPSALDIFFQCPRRFYLKNVLGIPEEEPDDPFMVISAADIGTIAHSMMEEIAGNNMNMKDFLELSGKAFDEFLLSRPPLHIDDANREKREFLKMMENAFIKDPKNDVISAEKEYNFEHPSGVKLHGYPDRVEKDKDGNLLIADFKTGRNITHIKNDIDTCFQVIVYAWLLEKDGINISKCEYRYLRKGQTIPCEYNEDIKDKLNEKLLKFKEAVLANDFPRSENKTSCKYCKMSDICLWESDVKSEEDE